MQTFGTFPPNPATWAFGINNSGQVVGQAELAVYNQSGNNYSVDSAFLYTGGTMENLGTFGGMNSYASGINNNGQVVGQADLTGGTSSHAFLYTGGTMQDLGTLPGYTWISDARCINDSGQVAGWSENNSDYRHAFLYSGGTMEDLGTLGGAESWANGINDSGQVVGDALTGSNVTHAFLFSDGGMEDLNDLIDPTSG